MTHAIPPRFISSPSKPQRQICSSSYFRHSKIWSEVFNQRKTIHLLSWFQETVAFNHSEREGLLQFSGSLWKEELNWVTKNWCKNLRVCRGKGIAVLLFSILYLKKYSFYSTEIFRNASSTQTWFNKKLAFCGDRSWVMCFENSLFSIIYMPTFPTEHSDCLCTFSLGGRQKVSFLFSSWSMKNCTLLF